MKKKDIKVLIVDDHELTRYSLKLLLSGQKNITVVALASNGKEAIEEVKQNFPDVVILDVQMPIMDGLTASSHIKAIAPQTKIIAYTSVEDPQMEVMTQTAPIDYFCQKDIAIDLLIGLINRLAKQTMSYH